MSDKDRKNLIYRIERAQELMTTKLFPLPENEENDDADFLWSTFEDAKDMLTKGAPKVAEKDAVEAAAKAIQERYWKGDLAISIRDAKGVCTEFAKAALRAAGVRFKEEASSNPEPGASR